MSDGSYYNPQEEYMQYAINSVQSGSAGSAGGGYYQKNLMTTLYSSRGSQDLGGQINKYSKVGSTYNCSLASNNPWAAKAQNALGTFGLANETKNLLLDYASKAGKIGDNALMYLKVSKAVGRGAGVIGLGITLVDGVSGKGGWQNHHTADMVVGVTTVFLLSGPWGWAIGGAYFITDIAVQGYTGRSITENLFDPTPVDTK